ncbi:MAG: Uma2 family endonuclease [Acaryochloridaceae cyanobacterium RL_2_7]|nr:Uma2 family endonuclease [Acaryochloridaceae cyanobacterium RL_2_7]
MQAQARQLYSPEEYLNQEEQSEVRHAYLDGEIVPMVGGTPNHNRIILNVATLLNVSLKRQPYQVFVADQRLWIPSRNVYTYPDVMVISGDFQLQEGRKDTITNPALIVEVLSSSTQAYDQTDKFKAYRSLESLQEYILIDQYSIHIEQYIKQSDRDWRFTDYDGEEAELKLASVPLSLSLLDIYDRVTFDKD